MRKILLLGAVMALLLSCSDDTTYVEYDADPVMVESYKELSNLDASNYSRGTRIFVRNEDCFYSWDGKSWNEIEEVRSSSGWSFFSSDDYEDESSDSDDDIESSDDDEESSSSEESEVKIRSSSSEEDIEYSSSSEEEESSSSRRASWENLNDHYSYGEFVDERNGYMYKTIEIEGRTWFAENLNYDIPEYADSVDACFMYNDTLYCEKFGRYYTWYAMMNISPEECNGDAGCPELYSYPYRGVCPKGWHLPDSIEVADLIELFGGMRAAGSTLYAHSFGFNFIGAGSQSYANGKKSWSNEYAGYSKGYLHFVSETEFVSKLNPVYFVDYYSQNLRLTSIGRNEAIPVRCVKDDPNEIERRKNLAGEE